MTDKERCDALLKLAELQSNIREKRRDIEWKVSIGLWAITAGAAAYLKGRLLPWPLMLLLLAVIWLIHTWMWVRVHFNTSERDAKQVYYYMQHALKIVKPESGVSPDERLPFPKFGTWDFLKHEPLRFEVVVTLVLGLIIVILASR